MGEGVSMKLVPVRGLSEAGIAEYLKISEKTRKIFGSCGEYQDLFLVF